MLEELYENKVSVGLKPFKFEANSLMANEAPKPITRESFRQCRTWSQFLGDKLSLKNYNDRRWTFHLLKNLAPVHQ